MPTFGKPQQPGSSSIVTLAVILLLGLDQLH
jgi:hypothetical protein